MRTGPQHAREANRLVTDEPMCTCERTGCVHEQVQLQVAQVHATLAAAPEPWLTCVDQINGTGTYPLSLRHVVYIRRTKGNPWWHAIDVRGGAHVIATEDDAKVEALMGGGPS